MHKELKKNKGFVTVFKAPLTNRTKNLSNVELITRNVNGFSLLSSFSTFPTISSRHSLPVSWGIPSTKTPAHSGQLTPLRSVSLSLPLACPCFVIFHSFFCFVSFTFSTHLLSPPTLRVASLFVTCCELRSVRVFRRQQGKRRLQMNEHRPKRKRTMRRLTWPTSKPAWYIFH